MGKFMEAASRHPKETTIGLVVASLALNGVLSDTFREQTSVEFPDDFNCVTEIVPDDEGNLTLRTRVIDGLRIRDGRVDYRVQLARGGVTVGSKPAAPGGITEITIDTDRKVTFAEVDIKNADGDQSPCRVSILDAVTEAKDNQP